MESLKDYLTIGEFSKLSKTSIYTLRHYHEKNLLIPVYQNEESGYRYYDAQQLPHIFMLRMMKDLGFSLKKMAKIMVYDEEGAVDLGRMHEAIAAHKLHLEEEIKELLHRQEVTEALLTMVTDLDKKVEVVKDEIKVKTYGERLYLIHPQKLNWFSTKDYMARYFALTEKVRIGLLQVIGPSSALVLQLDENMEPHDILVSHEVKPKDALQYTMVLPEGTYASLIFGGYQDACTRKKYYKQLLKWIRENGYKPIFPLMEIYLVTSGLSKNQEQILTEIQLKIQ